MKHLFAGLAMLVVAMSFGQTNQDKEKFSTENH